MPVDPGRAGARPGLNQHQPWVFPATPGTADQGFLFASNPPPPRGGFAERRPIPGSSEGGGGLAVLEYPVAPPAGSDQAPEKAAAKLAVLEIEGEKKGAWSLRYHVDGPRAPAAVSPPPSQPAPGQQPASAPAPVPAAGGRRLGWGSLFGRRPAAQPAAASDSVQAPARADLSFGSEAADRQLLVAACAAVEPAELALRRRQSRSARPEHAREDETARHSDALGCARVKAMLGCARVKAMLGCARVKAMLGCARVYIVAPLYIYIVAHIYIYVVSRHSKRGGARCWENGGAGGGFVQWAMGVELSTSGFALLARHLALREGLTCSVAAAGSRQEPRSGPSGSTRR